MITFYLLAMSCLFALAEEAQDGQCGCSRSSRRAAFEELERQVKQDGSVLVDDMILTAVDLEQFKGTSKFRAALEANKRWPRGELFYEMSRMNLSAQQTIRLALTTLSQRTNGCVRFTEVQPGHTGPHVSVFNGEGCSSSVGLQGGKQNMSLSDGCIRSNRSIMHEFMHALGFKHEHVRPDRDEFIRINWGAINSSMCHNFQKCVGCTITTPYDLDCIMHYSSNAFKCGNGQKTILTTSQHEIRYKVKLTQYDVKKIKDYYQCS